MSVRVRLVPSEINDTEVRITEAPADKLNPAFAVIRVPVGRLFFERLARTTRGLDVHKIMLQDAQISITGKVIAEQRTTDDPDKKIIPIAMNVEAFRES